MTDEQKLAAITSLIVDANAAMSDPAHWKNNTTQTEGIETSESNSSLRMKISKILGLGSLA